jgi:hypothetical protein
MSKRIKNAIFNQVMVDIENITERISYFASVVAYVIIMAASGF